MRRLSGTVEGRKLAGTTRTRGAIRQFVLAGHSLGAGGGSSDADFDSSTRLASVLGGASEDNWAQGGAILHWNNTNVAGAGLPGNGGYGAGLQALYQRPLLSTTVTTQANSGQAVVIMGTTAGLVPQATGQYPSVLNIGTGANGEVHTVKTVDSGTQVTLTENLASTHVVTEPVFQTPGRGYTAKLPLFVSYWGINDLASMTPFDWVKRFINPQRMLIARSRCAWVAEDDHSSFVRGGTNAWQTAVVLTGSNSGVTLSGNGGPGLSTGTLHVPDDFPGTPVNIAFVWLAGLASVVTVTVDGSSSGFTVNGLAQNTWDFTGANDLRGRGLVTAAPNITPVNKNNSGVMRLEGLTPGRHTIVFSTTDTAADIYFDWWGIEAPEPPLHVMVDINKLPTGYSYYSPPTKPTAGVGTTWPGAQQAVTLQAQANAGATTISVNDTSPASMYVATPSTGQLPMPNQIIRLANGATVEYKRVHGTTAMTGTGPFVITLDSALANTFTVAGTTVTIGLQDASVDSANADMRELAKEFKDGRVAVTDIDSVIAANPIYLFREGPSHYVHLNDRGQAVVTGEIIEAIENMPWPPHAAATASTPSAPVPGSAVFFALATAAAGAAFTIQTTGTTEWGTLYRRRVDCRRVRECRVVGWMAATTVAGGRLRLQYSVDGGTTWVPVNRSGDYGYYTGAQASPDEITVAATGEKIGAWTKLPPEARRDNVLFRFVQMATAAGTPTWNWLEVQFRG